MPLNKPALDSRGYREILSVAVMIASFALTMAYPDVIPLATYIIQPGVSALRDASIPVTRSLVNAIVWGAVVYSFVRVSERLRHKGR
jgi:hypothetical protein